MLALVTSFAAPSAIAQTSGTTHVIQDLETWTSAGLNYKFNKKLSFSLSEQLRLKNNSSTVDVYFTQLETEYKVAKGLSLGLGLRYIRENDDEGKVQGYENHLRWNADLGYKHKIDRFTMRYRVRYQSKDELGVTTDLVKNVVRFKLGTGYNIKNWKFDPTASAEIFNGLTDDEGLYKLRFTLGTKYETKNAGDFGLFLRTENQLQGEYPKRTNIIGLKYEYTLKRKQNEK